MSDRPDEIVVRYDSAADAIRALKKMRRFGLGSPKDHLAVEGVRVVLVIVPMALVILGLIRFDHAIAAYCGYFALRWFDRYVKPALLKQFGPLFPANEITSPLTMVFDPNGIRSETTHGLVRANWSALPEPRSFRDGMIFRLAPEQSLVVAASHLPEGMTLETFASRVHAWRAGAAA